LIERTEDPEDRRMKKISLTNKGSRIFKESLSARLRWLDELEKSLTEQEKETITSALKLMINKARKRSLPVDE